MQMMRRKTVPSRYHFWLVFAANVPAANITDFQRMEDEQAVEAFLKRHSFSTLDLTFSEDAAKQITDMVNYLAKRFNSTPQQILQQVIEQAYLKEKNSDGTTTASSAADQPAA